MRHTQTERSGKATLRRWRRKPEAGERVSHAGIWEKSRRRGQAAQGPWGRDVSGTYKGSEEPVCPERGEDGGKRSRRRGQGRNCLA